MNFKKAQILVVGGTGFIGSHVVNRAQAIGFSVVRLGLGSRPYVSDGVENISADLSDAVELRKKLSGRKFEYVVNCGGYVDHRLLYTGGRAAIDSHFVGLINLVECIERDNLKGFVNIGSSDEYGAAPAPQIESLREAPISPYSLAKLASTQFLQMLHRTEGFPATTLRLFLTYGPGQDSKRFIPQIIAGCISGVPFPTSSGDQLRDFCYIDDTVDAIFAALDVKEGYGEVINIGSGRPVTIRRMIQDICMIVGGGFPQYGALPYRPNENRVLYADTKKAQAILGWSSRTDHADGLARTVDHFKRLL